MDNWQFTPLHEAAAKQRVDVCSLLLAHGANPKLVNCHGKSVLDICPTRELQEKIVREYRGHQFFDSLVQATDLGKVKKSLTADLIGFKHPFTGDSALHVAVSLSPPPVGTDRKSVV